jgi:type I restriction enzyme, S subunit
LRIFYVPRDFQTKDLWLDPERLWHEQQMGDLPTAELIDLIEVVTATWSPSEAAKNDTFSYIDISSIDIQSGRIAEVKSISADDAPARAKRMVHAGDVLVSTVRPDRGAVAIVPESLDGAVASTAFIVLRPTRTSSAVVWAWLRSPEVRERLSAGATGAIYPTLRQSQVLELQVPVHTPDAFSGLAQQVQQIINRTVSASASEGDETKGPSLLQKFGIQVQKQKESTFWVDRSALSADRLDPETYMPHHADLIDRLQQVANPVLPLKDVATVTAGTPTKSTYDEGVSVLRPRNLRDGRVDVSELSQAVPLRTSVPVKAGDILVTVMGARSGEAALVSTDAEGLLFDNNLALVRIVESDGHHQIDPEYLVAFLNSDLGQMLVSREASSLGVMQRLSVAGLRELPVILPSLSEQRRIAAMLKPSEQAGGADNDDARLVKLGEAIVQQLSQVGRR